MTTIANQPNIVHEGPHQLRPDELPQADRRYADEVERQSSRGEPATCKPEILTAVGKSLDDFKSAVRERRIARRRKALTQLETLPDLQAAVELAEEQFSRAVNDMGAVREHEPWKVQSAQNEVYKLESEVTSARDKRMSRERNAREVLDKTSDPSISGSLWFLSRLRQEVSEGNSGRVINQDRVPPEFVPVLPAAFTPLLAVIDEQIAELQQRKHDPELGICE